MPRRKNSFSSNLTLSILLLLHDSQLTTYMLSKILSLPSNYVSSYLSILRKKKLISNDEEGYWCLTEKGLKIIEKIILIDNLKQLIKQNYKQEITSQSLFNQKIKLKAKETQRKHKINTKEKPKKYKTNTKEIIIINNINEYDVLAKIQERLGRKLTKVEEEIIHFIISYTSETGRKYWWPSTSGVSLAEALWENMSNSISINEISQALRELEAKAIIYITFDKRRNVPKIRLDRSLIN